MSDDHERQHADRERDLEAQRARERADIERLDAERAWRRELEARRHLDWPPEPGE
jgi:hypothetical protein